MAQAYTPGLQVSESTTVTKVRELPLPGKELVKVGDRVKASTTVLEAQLPGDLYIIRLAERMGFTPEEVIANLMVKNGDEVKSGQLLCQIKTFFNLFCTEVTSPRDATVEFITQNNAHVGLREPSTPLFVNAYISGEVTEVELGKSVTIKSQASIIQGIFGVGGETSGEILNLDVDANEPVNVRALESSGEIKGKVLIGGSHFTRDAIKRASAKGAKAIVTGSIDALTLKEYVGYDIGVSITGDENVPCTFIVTEGFGTLSMSSHVIELAKKLQGKLASVNGATQVRAGAMRPEVIVANDSAQNQSVSESSSALDVGSRVRIIRVPHFGSFGKVAELPVEPQRIASGAKVRVLIAELDSGEKVTVPRANVELVNL